MERILIATDFSENAWQATMYGYALATQLKTNITLFTAIAAPTTLPEAGVILWPEAQYDELLTQSKEHLERIKDELLINAFDNEFIPLIRVEPVAGDLVEEIKRLCSRDNVSLIIIGIHGGGALDTVFLGSNAHRMINEANKPLLLVPPGAAIHKAKHVTLITDLKQIEKEARTIQTLIPFLTMLDLSLELVHVYEGTDHYQSTLERIRGALTDIVQLSGYARMSYDIVRMSSLDRAIDWLCNFGHVEILAMVHRKHSFFKRLVDPSRTQHVAKHPKAPLLVLPEAD